MRADVPVNCKIIFWDLSSSLALTKTSLFSDNTIGVVMIELTRLNGHKILVNSELIRDAESSPDTVLTLVTGEKLLVRETCAEVAEIVFQHHIAQFRAAWPDALTAISARLALDARIQAQASN